MTSTTFAGRFVRNLYICTLVAFVAFLLYYTQEKDIFAGQQVDLHSKEYDLKPLGGPVISDPIFRFVVELTEMSPFSLFQKYLREDNDFAAARRLAAQINLPGKQLPLVKPTKNQLKFAKDEAKHFNIKHFADVKTKPESNGFRYWSIEDFARAYREGTATPTKVALSVIEAIKDSNSLTPSLAAVIKYREDLILEQAEASTLRFQKKEALGVFDGIPVLFKDDMHVKGFNTSQGTSFIGKELEVRDSYVARKLRSAGAILVGKTNLHEIGIGVTGHNKYWGTPRNPYNTAHYTGGSSSGSAAAVAAGIVPVALGTDGGGSVRIPSGLTGIVGLKPNFGRISEEGLPPLCWSVSHIGPLVTSVKDAALVYALLAGPEKSDEYTMIQPPVHMHLFNAQGHFQDITMGVFGPWITDCQVNIRQAVLGMIQKLANNGANVKKVVVPHLHTIRVSHAIQIASEMASSMDKAYSTNRKDFGTLTRANLNLLRGVSAMDYIASQKVRAWAIQVTEELFKEVDVLIVPNTAITAPPVRNETTSDLYTLSQLMKYQFFGNMVGIPAITVPIGYDDDGLPISIQIMAPYWREDILFRLGGFIEKQVKKQKPSVYYDILG